MNYITMKDPSTMAPIAVMPAKSNGILMCAPVGSSNEKIVSNLTEVRRVPCKARGVRGDHNIRTAFFDIPVNAEHGTMLVCSHDGCAASGRRFRYCAVCDLPVAKRNFSKRHGHGLIKPSRGGGGPSDSVSVATKNTLAGTKHRRTVSNTEYVQQANLPQTTVPPPPAQSPSQPVTSTVVLSSPSTFQTVPSTHTTGVVIGAQDPNTGMMTMQLNPLEFQWLALFHNRPHMEDAEAMNRWMDNVLQLSEPTTVPSVTPPSWNTANAVSDAASFGGPIAKASSTETLPAVDISSKELQPNTAETSQAIAAAEINTGLALAEAASTAAAALPSLKSEEEEMSLPPLKRQRSDKSSVLSDWTESEIDKVLAL